MIKHFPIIKETITIFKSLLSRIKRGLKVVPQHSSKDRMLKKHPQQLVYVQLFNSNNLKEILKLVELLLW